MITAKRQGNLSLCCFEKRVRVVYGPRRRYFGKNGRFDIHADREAVILLKIGKIPGDAGK